MECVALFFLMKECVALQEEYSFNGEKAFSSDLFPFPDKKNVTTCYQKIFRLNIHSIV
jgi:hypothetical protein